MLYFKTRWYLSRISYAKYIFYLIELKLYAGTYTCTYIYICIHVNIYHQIGIWFWLVLLWLNNQDPVDLHTVSGEIISNGMGTVNAE